MNLKEIIRNVPDFPKEGIQFKDISTLIQKHGAFKEAVDWMVSLYMNRNIDKVVAVESRGFIFGAPLALSIGAGLVLVRKKGKLPAETISASYELEYGSDELEMHRDAILPEQNVVIVDDLLATGGTTKAVIELVNKVPAKIEGICFLIELGGLKGRDKLNPYMVDSLIKFEGM
jgi:adenine phosphoribosyltransferase